MQNFGDWIDNYIPLNEQDRKQDYEKAKTELENYYQMYGEETAFQYIVRQALKVQEEAKQNLKEMNEKVKMLKRAEQDDAVD